MAIASPLFDPQSSIFMFDPILVAIIPKTPCQSLKYVCTFLHLSQ